MKIKKALVVPGYCWHETAGSKMPRIITAIAGVLFFGAGAAYCETYTMETYYPSPAGVYQNMTVTSTTVLARDGGAVTVGSAAKPARLEVNGVSDLKNVVVPGRFASDPTGAEQKIEGAIYFNTTSKKHRVFQNGAWTDQGAVTGINGFIKSCTERDCGDNGRPPCACKEYSCLKVNPFTGACSCPAGTIMRDIPGVSKFDMFGSAQLCF